MSVRLTIRLTPALDDLVTSLRGDVYEGIGAGTQNLLSTLEALAVKDTPVDTSDLVNSITSYLTDRGFGGVLKATAEHAFFVHEGTGLFGPHKKKIVPKNKKALWWPGARHPVRSVKGQKPKPFFTDAIKATDNQKVFEEGLGNYLRRRGW